MSTDKKSRAETEGKTMHSLSSRILRWAKWASAGVFMLASGVAWADGISPTSFSADLAVGDSVTLRKTVTVSASGPTAALIDVVFVFDITGSMGGAIAGAKASAAGILTSLGALGNVASATGWYADPTFDGTNSALTTTAATTTAAINLMGQCTHTGALDFSLCGGDTPEVMYAGIKDAADNTAWRAGSNRFIVVLADAITKTPPTTAQVIASLSAANAEVIGINFGSITTSINAIGGSTYNSSISAEAIAAAIVEGITGSFGSYGNVTVGDLGAGMPEIAVSTTCVSADIGSCVGASAIGTYDRSVDRTFTFDVTFTRVAAGDKTFDTHALVNAGIVASERDTFGAGGGTVPEPGSLSLIALGFLALGATLRRRTAG